MKHIHGSRKSVSGYELCLRSTFYLSCADLSGAYGSGAHARRVTHVNRGCHARLATVTQRSF
jgi:hypothetical protein